MSVTAGASSSSSSSSSNNTGNTLTHMFRNFEMTYRDTYLQLESIAQVIASAGQTLRTGGTVMYVSDYEPFALFGMLDASECPPTFGANFTDIQGVVRDGWQHLPCHENMAQLRASAEIYDISWSKLNALKRNDLLVALHLNVNDNHPSTQLIQALGNAKEKGKRRMEEPFLFF
jgi:N-acetylmuramic acid 6-phosphate (MurNAc-6-P) etherase